MTFPDKRTKKVLFSLDGATVLTRDSRKSLQFHRGEVGHWVHLQVTPQSFHRIEFRRIRGKEEAVGIRPGLQKPLNHSGTVRKESVPYQNNRAFDLSAQVPEKVLHRPGADVGIRMQPEIEADSISLRIYAQSSDDRNFSVGTSTLVENRRFSGRRPTSFHQGRHQKTAFVYENQTSIQAADFFLMRSQSVLSHCLIAFSFRSTARRVGRCGLQPNEWSKRQIWST